MQSARLFPPPRGAICVRNLQQVPPRRSCSRQPKSYTKLEVESKFNVTALLRSQLDSTVETVAPLRLSTSPPLPAIKFTKWPNKLIHDQYFDENNKLAARGIWLRKRTHRMLQCHDFPFQVERAVFTQWEAKVRLGGDFQNSQFEEIVGKEQVMSIVKQHINDLDSLKVVVDLESIRQSWIAQQDAQSFNIVIDSSSSSMDAVGTRPDLKQVFRHVVGEVELERSMALCGVATEADNTKAVIITEMRSELQRFLAVHHALFPIVPVPVGKLTAYFDWRRRVERRLRSDL